MKNRGHRNRRINTPTRPKNTGMLTLFSSPTFLFMTVT